MNQLKYLLWVVSFFTTHFCIAQTPKFQWVKQTGSSNWDEGRDLTVDDSGNVFCIGVFQGKVDFDPGPATYNLFAAGGNDIFISKTNASGKFLWAKKMGGKFQDFGNKVRVDKAGNIYTIGGFSDSSDFDPGAGRFKLMSAGYLDAYMSKWNDTGKLLWAKKIGGISNDIARAVDVDGAGNVYTAGDYEGTVDLNPDAGTNYVTGQGLFITKLNSAGNYVWARSFPTGVHTLKVDVMGNSYITGIFYGTIDFDPGAGVVNLTSAGDRDIFVVKLDSSGHLVWARKMGGKSYEGCLTTVLQKDKLYMAGYFKDTTDFNPGAGQFNLKSMRGVDAFIAQLDTAGNFEWAGQISGDSAEQSAGLAVDDSGNAYVAGIFFDSADYNPGVGRADFIAESQGLTIFVLKVDAAGNFKWAQNFGGGTTNYGPQNIGVDRSGNVYCGGLFAGTADFYPGSGTFQLTATPPNNSPDIYLLKLGQCNIIDTTINLAGTTLKANASGASYQWVDCNKSNTPITGAVGRTYTPTSSGRYAVIVTIGACSEMSSCHIVNVTGVEGIHNRNHSLLIYPNPNNGIFNLELKAAEGTIQFEIYNSFGAQVSAFTSSETTMMIDLSGFANGLYIVKALKGDAVIATLKFVKE